MPPGPWKTELYISVGVGCVTCYAPRLVIINGARTVRNLLRTMGGDNHGARTVRNLSRTMVGDNHGARRVRNLLRTMVG
jgi:hypothetical protein